MNIPPAICCQWVGKELVYLYPVMSKAFTIFCWQIRNLSFSSLVCGVNTLSGMADEIYPDEINPGAQTKFMGLLAK